MPGMREKRALTLGTVTKKISHVQPLQLSAPTKGDKKGNELVLRVWDPARWRINVLNHPGVICVWWGIYFGHSPAQPPSRVSWGQPRTSQGKQSLISMFGHALMLCPHFSPHGSTDVFICTSPIKKYRYCPYEKVSRPEFCLPVPYHAA